MRISDWSSDVCSSDLVSSGTSEPVSGVAALLVLTISSEPSVFFTSQVQPEPKLPAADLLNASLNAATLDHLALIAANKAPVGSPPPCGDRLDRKSGV